MKNLIDLIDPVLLKEGDEDPRYALSPFRGLKNLHAKQKGSRYEQITEAVLKKMGKNVLRPTNTDHDRIVGGKKVEIKGSTLNKNTENFSFLQIRPDQDYDFLYFSMFYPQEFVIMYMDKETIMKNIQKGIFKKQHGGNKAESGTYLYYGNKDTLARIGAKYVT